MGNYKIIFSRKDCIGSAECEKLSPEFWKLRNDSKSDLKGATLNNITGKYELVIDESKLAKQKIVVERCPVSCIKITKLK